MTEDAVQLRGKNEFHLLRGHVQILQACAKNTLSQAHAFGACNVMGLLGEHKQNGREVLQAADDPMSVAADEAQRDLTDGRRDCRPTFGGHAAGDVAPQVAGRVCQTPHGIADGLRLAPD